MPIDFDFVNKIITDLAGSGGYEILTGQRGGTTTQESVIDHTINGHIENAVGTDPGKKWQRWGRMAARDLHDESFRVSFAVFNKRIFQHIYETGKYTQASIVRGKSGNSSIEIPFDNKDFCSVVDRASALFDLHGPYERKLDKICVNINDIDGKIISIGPKFKG